MENARLKSEIFSGFRSSFSVVYDSFLTVLYPQACRVCEQSVESYADGFVCDACWRNTHVFDGREIICRKCGAFLKKGIPSAETFCRRCDADEYDSAKSVGLYENALSVSVLALKKQPFLSARLQKLILSAFINSPFRDATRIIPVPLSERRRRERGFNQASVIAEIVAAQMSLTIDERSLARIADTAPHRAGMDAKARRESVENAFEVKRPRLISGENILLVDDVFTSGATVSSCAKVLKKSGAKKVYVLTIARAF